MKVSIIDDPGSDMCREGAGQPSPESGVGISDPVCLNLKLFFGYKPLRSFIKTTVLVPIQ